MIFCTGGSNVLGRLLPIERIGELCKEKKIAVNTLANLSGVSPSTVYSMLNEKSQNPGVVSLQNDRGTSYSAYLRVQNEIVKAFNEIRDEFAMANYGSKYADLDEDKQKIVREAVPQSISEAEPKDVSKKR